MKNENKKISKDGYLKEALRICKDSRTSFKEEYQNPWENPKLTTAKLTYIDFDNKTAEVKTIDGNITIPINMKQSELDHLQDIGGYYGATAFLDKNNTLVSVSYLSPWNGTLTQAEYGADVYE